MNLKDYIRTIPDYPKPGILFRDVTTVFKEPAAFRFVVDTLVERYKGERIDKIAGIEARGFILGAGIAYVLGAGFVPVRKKGKLPAATVGHDYALEYGTDRVEIHTDAISKGDRVLIVDDLIATGGTAAAAIALVGLLGGEVVEVAAIVDLPELGGTKRIESKGVRVHALCEYQGH